MKVKCIVSHEKFDKNGNFKRYEAWKIYDLEKFNEKYFEPVEKKKKGDKK